MSPSIMTSAQGRRRSWAYSAALSLRVSRSGRAWLHTQALVLGFTCLSALCAYFLLSSHYRRYGCMLRKPEKLMAPEAATRTSSTRRLLGGLFSSQKIDLLKIQFDVTTLFRTRGYPSPRSLAPPYFTSWSMPRIITMITASSRAPAFAPK